MTSFYEELHKADSISDEQENAQSRANVDKWIFRLFLLIIGVMPIIVLANVEEVVSPLISNMDVLSTGTKGDLFTHYKALFVLIITIIASLLLLAKIFFMNGTVKKTFLNYVLGVFVIAIVVSTIMSPNITIALNGQYNRSDGAISWLCYVALMFIAMNIEYPKNVVRYIMYTMMPFVYINLYIITMNFYGKDLLQKEWVQKLVAITLPEGASLGEGSILVGTLNQWNYMSGMFGILTVMYLMAAILEKNIPQSVIYIVTSVLSVSIVLMSLSSSGFLTICIMAIVILFVAIRSEKKVQSFALILVFLIASAPILHVLSTKEDKVWTESLGLFIKNNPYGWKLEDSSALIPNEFDLFKPVYAAEQFKLPELPESGMSLGSGRIYIWGKTAELLNQKLFIGYGLDTIMYNFPHYNIDARAGLQNENTIVDKPHNMYVGLVYGIGIVGFFSIVGIIILSTFNLLKFAIKSRVSDIWVFWGAWGAYLLQALFNDSLPSISAIMWIIVGIGLSMILNVKEYIDGRND